MAEKLRLGNEVRELKIGQSFTNPKSTGFHSVRYDFKPASVDTSKKATVDVSCNNQVTVTVPHLDGAGTPQTVFKGSQRPYTKECVLVIDKVTGEITLEKLAWNIQLKKTRSEYNKLPPPPDRISQGGSSTSNNNNNNNSNDRTSNSLSSRSATPPTVGHRVSHKTKVTSGSRRPDRPITQLLPKHSPLHASPSYPSPNTKSPRRELHNNVNNESHNQSTLASLPMIGMDDFCEPSRQPPPSRPTTQNNTTDKSPNFASDNENGVGEISDSSSSSSGSDSDSDPDDVKVPDNIKVNPARTNGYSNGNTRAPSTTHLLNDDLHLSDSGSDSD